jgi:hypothetical protein
MKNSSFREWKVAVKMPRKDLESEMFNAYDLAAGIYIEGFMHAPVCTRAGQGDTGDVETGHGRQTLPFLGQIFGPGSTSGNIYY